MTKDAIKEIICSGVSTGTLALDDMLVFVNEFLEEKLIAAHEMADDFLIGELQYALYKI